MVRQSTETAAQGGPSAIALMRFILCAIVMVFLAGCMSRPVRVSSVPPMANAQNSYIDLQQGWRLRAIAPLTKSGIYKIAAADGPATGHTLTLLASDDFIGYETAYYSVQGRNRKGVRIEFDSAEDIVNGVASARPIPLLSLFQLPRDARFVRLLYVARRSQTDHNMAVLAAIEQNLLDLITLKVQGNPALCQDARHVFCSWIPSGIAVRPELRKVVNGAEQWAPAR